MVKARPCILAEAMNMGVIKRSGGMDPATDGYLVEFISGIERWIPEDSFSREFLPVTIPEGDDPVDVSGISPFLGRWANAYDVPSCVEFMINWASRGVRKMRVR